MKIKPFKGQVYFHVLESNRILMDGRVVVPGRTYHATKPTYIYEQDRLTWTAYKNGIPTQCAWGMHASNGFFYDAVRGSWICLVRLWGSVNHSESKSVAQRRKVIAMRRWNKCTTATDYFEIKWQHMYDEVFSLGYLGDLQKVADWVLAKPYMNIVAP